MSASDCEATDRETAYAKLNLALHVRSRLPDGYHQVETIFAFLDQGDHLSVQSGEGIDLEISGPFAGGLSKSNNLVLQAAQRLSDLSNITHGARLHLDKRLPVASGIGGGSADAAAALRLLNRFWNLGHSLSTLADIAKPLGADVPACVISQTSRGIGIGHDLAVIDSDELEKYTILLVNPLVPISTAEVFAAWDGIDRGALAEGPLMPIILAGRNDLQKPAVASLPLLSDILQLLEDCQPRLARMSGSGATCFALFDDPGAAEDAARHCTQAMAGIWTMIGKFR